MKTVNKPFRKKDAMQLVTGQPVYMDDIIPQDCLIVKLLRSPHANAIVRSINTAVAKKVPGIEAVFTWEDVPQDARRYTQAGQTYPEASPYDRLLIDRHVRFVGDVVAIVAGKDEKCVDKALKLIKVDYEVLEAVLDFHTAKDNPILVHPEDNWESLAPVGADNKRNLCAHDECGNGDIDAVLAGCDVVIDHVYHTKACQQAMMETFRTYCSIDTYGRLNVLSSTQIVFHARRNIANALHIPKSMVRVSKPRIGGGFGAKQTAVSEVYPAFVTWMTKKPSKLIFSRVESQTASSPRHEMEMHVRLGAMKDGTIRVGEGESQTGTVLVQPGQTVTIEANEPVKENESFHHWKVENGTSTAFAPTEGSLGSETEKGTEKIVFTMPQDGVKLTAVYSIPASVLRSTVTVTGGTAKSTLDEGSDIPAEIGTTVEITATPYDAEKYPGMEFVEWEIVYPDSFYQKFPGGIPENLQLKLNNAKSATTTFKMPVYPVKLIAHWSASAVAGPDEPIDEDFGVEPAPMDTTGGAIAAVAVGGAAIWGGYEIATRVILNGLLPEGAAIPANRGQLALLIWTEKGKPEPAAQPAFADITDAEQAKAAQWCVEQGLLDAREGKFESDGWMPKFKTIEIWNKAFPKK